MKRDFSIASVAALAGSALVMVGCAGGESGVAMPPREVVWSSVQLETEACRRRLAGAVFSGPVQVTGTQSSEQDGVSVVAVAYEVPVCIGSPELMADGTMLPLRGEVMFLYRAGAWRVHERHVRHWRAAGLVVMPEEFFP
jgi:hypothetical protein